MHNKLTTQFGTADLSLNYLNGWTFGTADLKLYVPFGTADLILYLAFCTADLLL